MGFIILLVIATLAIAGSAAYFSVYGLAQVFSGAFLSVIIMGASLEGGKLVAASFLYRFWSKINFALKFYLSAAILILMAITSMGISGYLTAAYQIDTISLRDMDAKLITMKDERDRLLARRQDMDNQIKANTETNYVTAAQRLMESYKPEKAEIERKLATLNADITKFQSDKLVTESKVGPIIFISKVLGSETDDAIFWLVVLIVIVFDPLAVTLTIATNIAIRERFTKKEEEKEEEIPSIPQAVANPEETTKSIDPLAGIEITAELLETATISPHNAEEEMLEVLDMELDEGGTVFKKSDQTLESLEKKLAEISDQISQGKELTESEILQQKELEQRITRKRRLEEIRRQANRPGA